MKIIFNIFLFHFYSCSCCLFAQTDVVFQKPFLGKLEGNKNFPIYSKKNVHYDEPFVRPFITDDARVVGGKLAQLETWLRIDKEAGQHWIMGAYGPNKNLELTVGGVYGYQKNHASKDVFSYALPLIQAKYLFKEYLPNKAPGVGLVVGTFLPFGSGIFKPGGYGTFSYLIVTQSYGENDKLLIHGNIGGNYLHSNSNDDLLLTWGVGTQIKTYRGFHLVGEIFSGDPYIPGTGMAFQTGYRYFINDLLQIDMTVGKGIAGENKMPLWFSSGVRVVTTRYLNKRNER